MQYLRLNYTYEINHHCRYTKYDPFFTAESAYQAFYSLYPSGVPHKSNWWIDLTNELMVCPYTPSDGEKVTVVFQEHIMTSIHKLSESLSQHLVDTSNVLEEMPVVDGS